MIDNAPILSCQHAGLTIEGYSRAAVQSYWRIPELKVGFDLGAQPWDFMGTPTWFLSHTHLDHVAALPVYVARRRMMRMEPPALYVPAHAVDDLRKLMLVFQRLDRGRQVCNLHGVNPGDEIEGFTCRASRQGSAGACGALPFSPTNCCTCRTSLEASHGGDGPLSSHICRPKRIRVFLLSGWSTFLYIMRIM